ncbi:MAG: hypothetical protein ACR2NA_02445 [Solirubrobacterales bacterium]
MHVLRCLPLLLLATLGVVTFDLVGLVVALATGRDPFTGEGTPISAPLPFVGVQLLVTAAALIAPWSRVRAFAAGAIVLLGALSVGAGFTDGSYAADLTVAERAIQVGLIGFTVAWALAGARGVASTLRGGSVARWTPGLADRADG